MQQEAAKWLLEEAKAEAKAKRDQEWKREEIGLKGKEDRLTEETKAKLKVDNKETVPITLKDGRTVNVSPGQALNAELRQDMMAQTKAIHESNQGLRRELADRTMDMRNRIPAGKVKEINDRMSTIQRYEDMVKSFDDKYAGKVILGPTMSGVNERLGRNKPAVGWWKDWRWMDNTARHEIFGASLTGNEKSEWDRTTISENTDPAIVKRELQKRLYYLQSAANRELDSYGEAGYNTQSIRRPGQVANPTETKGMAQPKDQPGGSVSPTPSPSGKPKTWEELKKKYQGQ
jgi:hypothetical protein